MELESRFSRRKFSRAFKVDVVKLVMDRGVAVAQAARDLDVAESVLRRCRDRPIVKGILAAIR